MTKKEIETLKKELEVMTQDRDSSIHMYQHFLAVSIEKGKTIDVLMPMVKQEDLNEALAELHDLRRDVKQLKSQKEYLRWKVVHPKKGFTDFLLSLGDFKKEDE